MCRSFSKSESSCCSRLRRKSKCLLARAILIPSRWAKIHFLFWRIWRKTCWSWLLIERWKLHLPWRKSARWEFQLLIKKLKSGWWSQASLHIKGKLRELSRMKFQYKQDWTVVQVGFGKMSYLCVWEIQNLSRFNKSHVEVFSNELHSLPRIAPCVWITMEVNIH